MSTQSERRMASGHWLLAASAEGPRTYGQWDQAGSAWLRPGVLFAVAVVTADVVHAAVEQDSPEAAADGLAALFMDGPAFFDPSMFAGRGAYAFLVPASAGRDWNPPGVVVSPPRVEVLVPAPGVCERPESGPWWVVAPEGPGLLCAPEMVAAVAGAGRARLAGLDAYEDPEEEPPGADTDVTWSVLCSADPAVEPANDPTPFYAVMLPRTRESAQRARRLVAFAVQQWGLEELEDDACLVMTELVSNAINHARLESLLVRVEQEGPGLVRVSVVDRSKVMPEPRAAGPFAVSGRGLAMVETLSGGRWGADPLNWGKRVWAQIGNAA
ncbi:ATP-binding protein [Actinacidiphila sp. ITFR-21]|uniref:ATP-binding protein n=1 Tax=Actinacidiphila sp. ITFR-21 TaxID=3075199 RepID=UPI00288B0418|nr:ATP-binding protein [Streptomyces sp. ITFR-21]WNI20300.1 ATP-binding protein [Streptomyces sp. ITFR-21]